MAKNRQHKINNVKVRFAPSPTGYLHIGGLRTYLYNWLFARKHNGKVVLRIEDTDRERLVKGAVENFINILKKMGLPWDEGPFFQSKNLKKYQEKASQLVKEGKAYYCFCSKKRLSKLREKQKKNDLPPKYDGHCRNLTKQQIQEKLNKGLSYVIRLKVPKKDDNIVFKDFVRGKISYKLKDLDDQVLLKSDGWPTYHLANVIDDHSMGITHVIRGEEWLPSTPKHVLLYKSFNWQIPQFVHVPLLLNKDHSKLSKRQGEVAVGEYLKKGYLKQALINFLALLGWNPGNDKEIFSLNELIQNFSLKNIQKSGAIFNKEKLDWLNGKYIREMTLDKLTVKCLPFLKKTSYFEKIGKNKFKAKNGKIFNLSYIKKIIQLQSERMNTLKDIVDLSKLFFIEKKYNSNLLIWKKMDKAEVVKNLKSVYNAFQDVPEKGFNAINIQKVLKELSEKFGTGEIFWPTRVALSCQKNSPQPNQIASILGKDLSLKRLKIAIDKLKKTENV